MKKKLLSLLILCLITVFLTVPASAADSGTCGAEGDNLTWTLNDAGALTITGTGAMDNYDWNTAPWYPYRESIRTVEIGSGVTSIGDSAFYQCTSLTDMTIPNTVTSIGSNAFGYCGKFTAVSIPASVTSISTWAFSGAGMTSITVNAANPNYCSMDGVLFSKDQTILIRYPASKNGSSYTIPNTVTTIGNSAFDGCVYLKALTIHNTVSSIGSNAFSGCNSLTTITIPASVTDIGFNSLYGCEGLTAITVDAANPNYCSVDGVLFSKDKTELIQYPCGKAGAYTVPNIVTSVRSHAFSVCNSLTSVTMTDSVTEIGTHLFSNCDSLTSVTLSGKLTEIPNNTFRWCPSLVNVTIPDSITAIGQQAFSSCTSLKTITIPASVNFIGNWAFEFCNKLQTIFFAGDAPTIPNSIFDGCAPTAYYPAGNATWTADVQQICGGSAVWKPYAGFGTCGTGLTWLLDSEGVLVIAGSGAMTDYAAGGAPWYANRSSIKTVTVSDGVTKVGSYAFDGCTNLKTVTFEDTAPAIGTNAFRSVTATAAYPLYDDTWAAVVKQSFGGTLTWQGFDPYVQSGTCGAEGDNLTWGLKENGTLVIAGTGAMADFLKSDAPWLAYRDDITALEIRSGVTTIGSSAFTGTAATSVTIPASVTAIGQQAFYGCQSLSSITVDAANPAYCAVDNILFSKDGKTLIHYPGGKRTTSYTVPAGVTTIESYALSNLNGLTEIDLGSVTTLAPNAIQYNWNLTSVTIPASVTVIGEANFRGCENLSAFIADAANPNYCSVDGVLFSKDGKTLVAYPGGKGTSYTVPVGVTAIGSYAFYNNYNITSVSLPAGLTSIGDYAFNRCEDLMEINLPDSVDYIGSSAFYGCISLSDIALPVGLNEIGASSFRGCTGLTAITIPEHISVLNNYLFRDCTNLKTITFDGSAPTSIGNNTFQNVTATVRYPNDDDTWKDSVKQNYGGKLTWTAVSPYVQSGTCGTGLSWGLKRSGTLVITGSGAMADYAAGGAPWYDYRTKIKAVTVPADVTRVGSYAFDGCTALTSVTFAGKAPAIGTNAFRGVTATAHCPLFDATWTGGAKQNYGGSLTWQSAAAGSLGNGQSWTLDDQGTLTISGSGKIRDFSYDASPWAAYRPHIRKAVIQEGITELGNRIFQGCTELSQVVLPASVTRIGLQSFYNCSALTDITLPANLTLINREAFLNSGLTSIIFPKELAEIEMRAFQSCQSLKDIIFTGSAPIIGENVFRDVTARACYPRNDASWTGDIFQNFDGSITWKPFIAYGKSGTGLTWLLDGDGALTVSGSGAMADYAAGGAPWYANRSSIKTVTIHAGVTKVGSYAFDGCTNLKTVTFEDTAPAIGTNAFRSVTATAAYPLYDDTWAAVVKQSFGGTITWQGVNPYVQSGTCGENLTWGLKKNGTLIIAGTGPMTNFQNQDAPWYESRMSISDVVIQPGVTTIGDYAFYSCANIGSISIPASVTSIGQFAFENCTNRLAVVDIPAGVQTIGDYAFAYCSNLTRVTIPDTVTEISDYAFAYNSKLNSITVDEANTSYCSMDNVLFSKDKTILVCHPGGKQGAYTVPGTVTMIGAGAFSGSRNVSSIALPKGLKTIGNEAFMDCINLTSIAIPASVTQIGPSAFTFTGITAINVDEANTSYCSVDGVLFNKSKTVLICYPSCKSGTAYTIPAGVKSLEMNSFRECTELTSVTIPNTVVEIGNYAFAYCENITSLTLPTSVKTIGNYAFRSCSSLTSMILPRGVTTIGHNAFRSCTKLTGISIPVTVTNLGRQLFYQCNALQTVAFAGTQARWNELTKNVDLALPGTATVTFGNAEFQSLSITGHPKDVTAANGKPVTFHVAADGNGLTYQWQASADGQNWSNTALAGYNTTVLTVTAGDSVNGWYFRCAVTDGSGKTVISRAAQLNCRADGMHLDKDGVWRYYLNGAVAADYTGLVPHTNGMVYYVKNGVLGTSFTGLHTHTNGYIYYVHNGIVASSYVGLYKHTNGYVYYLNNGVVTTNYTGLFKHTNGYVYYLNQGVVASNFTGLYQHTNGYVYYLREGIVVSNYTGLYKHTNGTVYYLNNGIVTSDYTGLFKHTNGNVYYLNKGVVVSNYIGLYKHTNGNIYYLREGIVISNYTGLYKHTNGSVYYLYNGIVASNHSGFYKHTDGKLYLIQNGIVAANFTGLALHSNGLLYYVAKGIHVPTFNGTAKTAGGVAYTVVNGIARP